jgi:hypothetical protein
MLRCPRCGQQAARRSRRVGARDHLLSVLHLYPFRCQLCTARFRAFQAPHHSEHGADRREYDRLLVRVPVTLLGEAASSFGETTDLSLAGCSIRTEAVLAVGATVAVRLGLGEAGEIEVQSALVRARGDGGFALQFVRIAPADRAHLGRYLGRFLRPTGTGRRRRGRLRPEMVLAAAIGLGVIVVVFLLLGGLGGPPVP